MTDKPKVAFYWCASCGGCEESVVDLAEAILEVVQLVDIVFWPVAIDTKKADVERMADGSIAVSLINGAVRTSEQEEMAQLLRRKSQLVVAYGSCAQMGGIPALANQYSRERILRTVYEEVPTVDNPNKVRPQPDYVDDAQICVHLPEFRQRVRSLDQVVDVDYTLPGCPPTPKLLAEALHAILDGNLPPKGTVLAPDTALCDACPRKDSKPEDVGYTEFKRPHWTILDPEKCFLAQGVVCMGPATRSGCDAQCIRGNMPCTGCFGPTSRVHDQGAKIVSSICSSIAAEDSDGIESTLSGIPDPVGTFYRYGLSKCLLRGRVDAVDAARSSQEGTR
ncbi:oxidoreductase [Candidatus Sumerlaeota bacterium]|nr:oxidoreductase [Candidatus Sumerlaeota bacterium]